MRLHLVQKPNHFQKSPRRNRIGPRRYAGLRRASTGAQASRLLLKFGDRDGRAPVSSRKKAECNRIRPFQSNWDSVGLPNLCPALVEELRAGLQIVMAIRALCRKLRRPQSPQNLVRLQRRPALDALRDESPVTRRGTLASSHRSLHRPSRCRPRSCAQLGLTRAAAGILGCVRIACAASLSTCPCLGVRPRSACPWPLRLPRQRNVLDYELCQFQAERLKLFLQLLFGKLAQLVIV